jgi:predicted amidohydrolase YtcJ
VVRSRAHNLPGGKLAPEEAVSVEEALATYTTHAAWADWEEERRGSLEMGKVGDLFVLRNDPVRWPSERLQHLMPEATLLGGVVVSGELACLEVGSRTTGLL